MPVIGTGDKFFAEKAGAENGDERQLGSKLNAREHGGDGGDDDYEGHGREVALGLFVGFGEESDGHEHGGEKNGNGESHEKDRDDGFGAEMKQKSRSSSTAAGGL